MQFLVYTKTNQFQLYLINNKYDWGNDPQSKQKEKLPRAISLFAFHLQRSIKVPFFQTKLYLEEGGLYFMF